jgi:hypothetical protein
MTAALLFAGRSDAQILGLAGDKPLVPLPPRLGPPRCTMCLTGGEAGFSKDLVPNPLASYLLSFLPSLTCQHDGVSQYDFLFSFLVFASFPPPIHSCPA